MVSRTVIDHHDLKNPILGGISFQDSLNEARKREPIIKNRRQDDEPVRHEFKLPPAISTQANVGIRGTLGSSGILDL
jgi:hypothetical protein